MLRAGASRLSWDACRESHCRVGREQFSSFKDLCLKPSQDSGPGLLKRREFPREVFRKRNRPAVEGPEVRQEDLI